MRWLLSYSALLGPLGGVLLADLHLVRKRQLVVQDLYSLAPEGHYFYQVMSCAGWPAATDTQAMATDNGALYVQSL